MQQHRAAWRLPVAACITMAVLLASGCGTGQVPASDETGVAEIDPAAGAPPTPTVTVSDLLPWYDPAYASDVAGYLQMGKVTIAALGEVAAVQAGPTVPMSAGAADGLSAATTVVVDIRVTESLLGDERAGDIVTAVFLAGAGLPLADFEEALPIGARVLAMSTPRPVESVADSDAAAAEYPPGLERRPAYLVIKHPQALMVDPLPPGGDPWPGYSFDDLVRELRAATQAMGRPAWRPGR